MDGLQLLALEMWSDTSSEGVLVLDSVGTIRLINARLRDLLKLRVVPRTLDALVRQAETCGPEVRALLDVTLHLEEAQWGNLRIEKYPPQRLVWQQVPLIERERVAGALVIFRDATTQGQLELAKQSFLSMISHDLRTPLSTILGFAELLYNNRGSLSTEEQHEFLEHIIKNANQLSQYTQIALDIMYLEANLQNFDTEAIFLDRFVRHWLSDARHRFNSKQIVYHDGVAEEPMTRIAPAALHRILYILVEFALAESPADQTVDIRLRYDQAQAHVTIQHKGPQLSQEDAAVLFRLLHPRDLSEVGRPHLHRMQLYVASLLAERQDGYLTLRGQEDEYYELDLTVPIAADNPPNNP